MRRIFVIAGIVAAVSLVVQYRSRRAQVGPEGRQAGHDVGRPQLTFGPDGILFVGRHEGCSDFAIDTADTNRETASAPRNIEKLTDRLTEIVWRREGRP